MDREDKVCQMGSGNHVTSQRMASNESILNCVHWSLKFWAMQFTLNVSKENLAINHKCPLD